MKRILTTNISPSGSLNTNAASKALLLHRNTPPQDMGVSPAELLFGRPLSDHMPKPIRNRREWIELADRREMAHTSRQQLANSNSRRGLQLLTPGETVSIQNQRGNHPKRWNAAGTVIDCLSHRQYKIFVDGSRRVTLRNRRFLRPISDTTRNTLDDGEPDLPPQVEEPVKKETIPCETPFAPPSSETTSPHTDQKVFQQAAPASTIELRRSTRERRPPQRYGTFLTHCHY